MALPDTALPGDSGHVADHNAITAEFANLRRGDFLTVGEETMPRFAIGSAGVTTASQRLMLSFFMARKTETTGQVVVQTGNVAAAATPTLVRVGVYQLDGSDNGTMVASTTNDTTLFAAAFTTYTKSLAASFTKTAGTRYALGILVVTAAATPQFYGTFSIPSFSNGIGVGAAPRLAGVLSGQADLPASFTDASLSATNAFPIAAVLKP